MLDFCDCWSVVGGGTTMNPWPLDEWPPLWDRLDSERAGSWVVLVWSVRRSMVVVVVEDKLVLLWTLLQAEYDELELRLGLGLCLLLDSWLTLEREAATGSNDLDDGDDFSFSAKIFLKMLVLLFFSCSNHFIYHHIKMVKQHPNEKTVLCRYMHRKIRAN